VLAALRSTIMFSAGLGLLHAASRASAADTPERPY
jgi:hypothetical protein